MKLSLSKINFLNIFFLIIIFSSILAFFIYEFNQDLYNKKVISLEKNYYKKNKNLIKDEIERAITRIATIKDELYRQKSSILKEKVYFINNLLDSEDSKNFIEFLKKYKNILKYHRWDNGAGYLYIFDSNGKILYHGTNQELVGKNVFETGTKNQELLSFLKESINRNESLGSYKWEKPNKNSKELYTKYVFVKKNEKYNIFIAAGIYKEDIENEAHKLIFDELRKDRYGDNKYGYFYITSLEKNMYMHPLNPEVENRDNSHVKDINGKVLVDVIVEKALNNGGYLEYKWIRPDTREVDEKFSYVKLIPDTTLIIGTGFYKSELINMFKEEKNRLKEISNEYLLDVFVVFTILIFISLLIARYLSLKIEKVEFEREEHMNLLEQYKFVLDESSVVSKTDKNGIITYVNDSFVKYSGFSKEETIGKTHSIVNHPETPKSQFKILWKTISRGNTWKGILKNKNKNGDIFYNNITIIPIKNSQGEILEYISAGSIVTELIENRTKLQSLFKTDALTGLGNRVSLIDYISKREKGVLALINIDRFKEINDSYSSSVGDEVLKGFADRLFEFFSEKNYKVYRLQADVFGVFAIFKRKDSVIDDIKSFMNTIGKEPYILEDKKFMLTYTCGIASNSENLLTYADIALSEAKNKNTKIKVYESSMKSIEEFRNNLQWVERLHIAIKEDRIFPHYQPIYNYKTGKIDKYEALMRLEEDGKIIYPNEYLFIAKNTKLYPELTYKMVEKVISKFSTNDLEFSINLCIEDLMNEELMIFIFDYAEQKGVFDRMVLEIVESEEIDDSDYINKLIKRFKDEGVKIAIDDFGSGYSNYEYLIKLQADYLKIDGSIIKFIEGDSRTQDVVKSILEFARKSNIKVIAEFVSNENIDKILREIGVDYAQGFYYGKPEAKLVEEI